MAEFYDLSEVALNQDGEAWGNLGYWKDSSEYSSACRALAQVLGDALGLGDRSKLFDAGFGCGDQVLLWLSLYGVHSVKGINFSKSQTHFAQSRLRQTAHSSLVDLRQGDVNDPGCWSEVLGDDSVNCVVALDCVYHFPSRKHFFELAAGRLQAGGCIGVTDFLLHDRHRESSIKHRALSWMLKRSQIPEQNVTRRDDYIAQLRCAGFADVEIEDISEWVMPAFKTWVDSQGAGTKARRLPWYRWLKYQATAGFLTWAYRKNVLRYCVISATKA